jgi:hypothetical protein
MPAEVATPWRRRHLKHRNVRVESHGWLPQDRTTSHRIAHNICLTALCRLSIGEMVTSSCACSSSLPRPGRALFVSMISKLRHVPCQAPLRVRPNQSGDLLCSLGLFIMPILLCQRRSTSRTQVFWPKRSQLRVGAPWGGSGGRTRRGRGNREEHRKVEPRYFGQNEANYVSVPPGEVAVAARAGEEGIE